MTLNGVVRKGGTIKIIIFYFVGGWGRKGWRGRRKKNQHLRDWLFRWIWSFLEFLLWMPCLVKFWNSSIPKSNNDSIMNAEGEVSTWKLCFMRVCLQTLQRNSIIGYLLQKFNFNTWDPISTYSSPFSKLPLSRGPFVFL